MLEVVGVFALLFLSQRRMAGPWCGGARDVGALPRADHLHANTSRAL